MQPSIIVGFMTGFGAMAFAILIDAGWALHAITAFFQFSAMLMIFGGCAGAVTVSFPVSYLKQIPVALRKCFLVYKEFDLVEMSTLLLSLSQKSRQEGILALEAEIPNLTDAWLRRGLQLVVDGLDRNVVLDIMETELDEYMKRTGIGAKVFASLGGYSPTMGIIGTVMGLVHMLANMEDPNKIGEMIAVAFLATFWGILLANLVFLPIAERTKAKDDELATVRKAMIEGLLSIQAGESVRIIEEKLKVFMDPDTLERFNRERGTAA